MVNELVTAPLAPAAWPLMAGKVMTPVLLSYEAPTGKSPTCELAGTFTVCVVLLGVADEVEGPLLVVVTE
jgi:hypothetical protein